MSSEGGGTGTGTGSGSGSGEGTSSGYYSTVGTNTAPVPSSQRYPPPPGSSAYRYGGGFQDPFNRPRILRLADACCYQPPPWCRPPCPPPPPYGCYPYGCYPPPPPPWLPPCCPPPLPPPCCPPVCGPKQVIRVPKGCRPPFHPCGDGPQPLYNNCNFFTAPPFPCSIPGPFATPCPPGDPCAPSPLPFRGPISLLDRVIRPRPTEGCCCKPCDDCCDGSCDNFFFKDLDYLADGSSSILHANISGNGSSKTSKKSYVSSSSYS